VLVLGLIVVLATLERISRARARHHGAARALRPMTVTRLTGPRAWLASVLCLIPFAIGFVLPVAVLAGHAFDARQWVAPGLLGALRNSLVAGGLAALIAVSLALVLVVGARAARSRLPARLLPVTAIGYAIPGAVLGIGILIPLAALDHTLADVIEGATGWDPGLILTGSAFALILAYVIRFFAVGQGASDAALSRIPPSLTMAARSLGRTRGGTLRDVQIPLIRASLGSALLLIFVDCVKELPATLLLRPFGYETLSTRVYAKAQLENLHEAAPAALIVTLTGLLAVMLLARANR
jgi:iron(III) transport system permease protein